MDQKKYITIFLILKKFLESMSVNSDFIRQIIVTYHASITRSVACGTFHTLLLLDDVCYSWGRNIHGELGLGDKINRIIPRIINLKNIIKMKSGSKHSLALSREKRVYVWGKNKKGQLGLSDNIDRLSPTKIKLKNIISAYCLGYSTMVLTASGNVFMWGMNSSGQLGLGNEDNHNSPQKLHLKNIVSISAGTPKPRVNVWFSEVLFHISYGKFLSQRLKNARKNIENACIFNVFTER